MKKYSKVISPLILTLIFQCVPFLTKAQVTVFEKIYQSTINQSGKEVLQTPDGGYLIAGTSENNIPNDIDIKIVKTDYLGDTVWTKMYGGNRPEWPNCMLSSGDGNYFVVGFSQSFGGGDQDIYLLKLYPNGDTVWTKRYGGFGNEDGKEIVATADGNFAIVGGSNSLNLNDNQMILVKIDPSGNVIWMKYHGGPNYESARSVKLCLDGGFILAGKTSANATSPATLYIVKTDIFGDTLWTKKYGGPNSYEGKSILANSDGTYTLCEDDSSGATDSDVRVMKLSSTGSIVWNYRYGGTAKDIGKTIRSTTDGGYIVSSVARSFGWINPDMWILKLTSLGDTSWTKHYGGAGHEHCYSVRQTADGGYIAVGHTKSFTPNTEIMLVKLDSAGNFMSVPEFAQKNSLKIYPNPSADGIVNIEIETGSSNSLVEVRNIYGQGVFSEKMNSGNNNNRINIGDQPPGIYFISLQSGSYLTTKKLILR